MPWFKFTGSNPHVNTDYTLNPSPHCIGQMTICAIFADIDTNSKPVLTTPLHDAIDRALNGFETHGVTQLKDL